MAGASRLLEHADRPGKKILISGGGRCNFTNLHCRPENFLSANPHFAKSALARYKPADFIALVEQYGIAYHEKTLGQLFCDHAARDIMNMLETECRAAGVNVLVKTPVLEVTRDSEFVVRSESQVFRAPALVVATGGLSIPKMGATGLGYDLARQFGLAIRETRPALVPFILSPEEQRSYCDLAGVSADGHRIHRTAVVSREDAADASRPQRPGDSADLVVLARIRARDH